MTRQSLEQGDLGGFLVVAVLPNLVWIVVRLAVVVTLGRQVARVGARAGLSRGGPGHVPDPRQAEQTADDQQ